MVAHAIAYAKQTTYRRSIMAHDQPNDMPCHDRQPGVETVMRLAALPLLCGSSHISIISPCQNHVQTELAKEPLISSTCGRCAHIAYNSWSQYMLCHALLRSWCTVCSIISTLK